MTTALRNLPDALPTDPRTGLTLPLSRSLGSQDLSKHRAMIALELEVLAKKFDRFGWERDRGTPAHDRQLLDWMDALQDYPLDEVRSACRAAVAENPNRMPNEGHVLAAISAARKEHVRWLPKPREPMPEPVDFATRRAEAERILREVGMAHTMPKEA